MSKRMYQRPMMPITKRTAQRPHQRMMQTIRSRDLVRLRRKWVPHNMHSYPHFVTELSDFCK